MNFKKIIREEINDFNWIKEVDPYSFIKEYYNKLTPEKRVERMLKDYAHLKYSKANIYSLINKMGGPSYLDSTLLYTSIIKYYKENLPLVNRILSRLSYDDLDYMAEDFFDDLLNHHLPYLP